MYFLQICSDPMVAEWTEQSVHRTNRRHSLLSVDDGYELIRFLEQVPRGRPFPDLIVFPFHMDRLSGGELIELLRHDNMYCLIPVLMLLPEPGGDAERICLRFGARVRMMPRSQRGWQELARELCTILD